MWSLAVLDSSAPDTDLALRRTATASSVDDSSRGPGNATDGAPGTRWSSAHQDDQWIRVDLGSEVPFDRVVITWETRNNSAAGTVTASWPADVAVSRPQVRGEACNAPPSTGNV